MNIDSTTIAIVMSAVSFVFAVMYLKSRLDNRFKQIHDDLDRTKQGLWQQIDEVSGRLSETRHMVAKQNSEKCDKSYYNSGT